jgi:UDP-N-acetylmuramate--alanine ligase
MNLRKIKKVHLIGVGGIGVSAVANMMLDLGKDTSGSDMAESKIIKELEKKGLIFYLGHKSENLAPDVDLVVYSPAIPADNPERQKAKKLDIPELSYPQMLGQLGKDRKVVAVSGTNGKTTTTSLLGLILEAAHEDPLVIVGSKVKNFKEGNLRLGEGEYFVVEACEYRAHMLNLDPQIIVLTNIEEDHLDYYKNLDHIIETFQKYVDKLPQDGLLILNNDDPVSREMIQKPKCKVATYGIKNKADVMAKNIRVKGERQYFDLTCSGQKIEMTFSLLVPGIFNIYNALAATATALELGVAPEIIKKVLENFTGTWRRFEKVGERGGAIIISDYAHHPTAVQGTIRAARDFYPGRRLVVVFQPHQRNRTKNLFGRFVKSLEGADVVILSEIYDVAGREEAEDQDISSKDIARELEKRYGDKFKKVLFACHLEETIKLILENIKPNDLVLVMGAGDIFQVAEELVK